MSVRRCTVNWLASCRDQSRHLNVSELQSSVDRLVTRQASRRSQTRRGGDGKPGRLRCRRSVRIFGCISRRPWRSPRRGSPFVIFINQVRRRPRLSIPAKTACFRRAGGAVAALLAPLPAVSAASLPVEAGAKTGAECDVGGALLAGLWEEPVAVTLVDDGTQNCPFGMQFQVILLAATHGADGSHVHCLE